ncbi:MAG: hypothetical protein AB7F40_07260 [Victivallaceae bacterium]|nr:hypothetical protein [Victivallaceae bacterium]
MTFGSHFRAALAALAMFAVSTVSAADIQVLRGALDSGDASVRLVGINGNPELNNLVKTFIQVSGWLSLSTSATADYDLRGNANSTSCEYLLSMGGQEFARGRVGFSNPREGAQKLVDDVMSKIFKDEKGVSELCQSRIAFCADLGSNRREIFICDLAGGGVTQITNFNSMCVEPCWAPDSKSIGYTKYSPDKTMILQTRLKPLGTKQLTFLKGMNVGVAFDPRFTKIAFVGSFENRVDLYIQNIGSNAQTRLTTGNGAEASPCWSPSGDSICFVSAKDGSRTPRLSVINLAAKTRNQLSTLGSEAATPDWSKKNKIVYSAKIGGSYKLAISDMTGETPPTQVTKESGEWESPSWAPDSRHVVCARTLGGKTALYVVDVINGKSRQLLSTEYKLTMPSWSPGAVR